MSEFLATSPALPGEAPTVEGRLADIIENAEIRVDEYRLSESDRAKVIAALRATALSTSQPAVGGDETENFQRWLADHLMPSEFSHTYLFKVDEDGNYCHSFVLDAWDGWKARAALAATPAGERWYLSSMNDGFFIINTPPRPSTEDVWHDRSDGPTLVIPIHEMDQKVAQKICDAHNAAPPARKRREDDGR